MESLGKQAAELWSVGRHSSIHDAVVTTVKCAHLSPEQVRRVVEFANQAAYLTEHKKEGMNHKYVDFGEQGPANPAEVLQELNSGGGGTVFDSGSNPYQIEPGQKVSSTLILSDEELSAQLFPKTASAEYAYEDPLRDSFDLYEKLAGQADYSQEVILKLERACDETHEALFQQVKQAALQGYSLADIASIWAHVNPDGEYVKIAFAAMLDPLLDSGVFLDPEELTDSLQKQAHTGDPDPDSPVYSLFQDYCHVISKLAAERVQFAELVQGAGTLQGFLRKHAAEGLAQKSWKALRGAAGAAERGGTAVGNVLVGAQHGKHVGTAAKYLTYAAPAVAGHEMYRRTLGASPTFQAAKRHALSAVPGTQEYYQKEMELQANNPYAMMGGY